MLQIIPESMFNLLHNIIEILTNRMKEVPTRLDKEKMKEFSQLDARYEVSRGQIKVRKNASHAPCRGHTFQGSRSEFVSSVLK